MSLLLWLTFSLSLVVSSTSGDVRITLMPDAEAPAGPIVQTSEDVVVQVPPTEPLTVQTVSGNIVIEAQTDRAGPLTLATVSGDVYLYDPPACTLHLTLTSGDVFFEGTPTGTPGGRYRVSTISGDIQGTLPPVSGWFRTVSGRLHLAFPHAAPAPVCDTLISRSGSVEVSVLDQPVAVDTPGVYRVEDYCLVVSTGSEPGPSAAEEEEEEAEVSLPKTVFRLAPVALEGSPLWVNYNRVDGFTLRIPLVRSHRSLTLGTLRLWTHARLAVSVAFGRRIPGETNRWKQRLGYWTGNEIGLQIGRWWPAGFLWADAWLNQTATTDRWTLSPLENFLASTLAKYDAYDYYLSSGIAAGLGLRWQDRLWVRVGYHTETVDSLGVTQTFSVFHSDEPFRPNPAAEPTDLEGLQVAAEARVPGGLTLAFWGLRGQDAWHLWQALARARWSHPLGDVTLRTVAGGTTFEPPSPLAVYLGGLGTVPGYDLHADSGTRFVLLNGEVRVSVRGPDLLLFADAGAISGHTWLTDAGLGLALGPLALRWVFPLEEPRRYRLYLRLRNWF